MIGKNQTTLVWDSITSPPEGYKKIMLWKSFDCEAYPDAISMPKVIEQNTDELKEKYLKFVYDIGIKKLNGQTVIDHMLLRKDFNYWWLTLIVEKSNYAKSTWINDGIRLLAFEKIIKKENISKIKLATSNHLLIKSFRILCLKYEIEIELQHMPNVESSKSIFRRIYTLLPLSLQGISSFCLNIVRRWSLRGVGLKEWKSTRGEITFISYFFNLVPESAEKGQYESRYWGHLTESLLEQKVSTNWLHIYVKDSVCPSTKHVNRLIQKFNQRGQEKQTHTTLDTFLGLKVIWNTLGDWAYLFKIGRKIQGLYSIKNDDRGYLWPYIKIDLNESLYGSTALFNLLNYNLFEEALRLLPKQKKGVFLQENQGWEFGLTQLWKSLEYGDLIGVTHSTISFWDLRYFFDTCVYNDTISKQLPRPNWVAVNGKVARNFYIKGGYPKNELVNVEALRFLYLNSFLFEYENKKQLRNNNSTIQLLVLGDYLFDNTHYQMRMLVKAFPRFPKNIKLLVKPHPNCPIAQSDYPEIEMEVTMESISTLLGKSNIAFTSNVTSAAIDAYCANVPVISILNPNILNMSPLMGVEEVEFVSGPDDLVNAIKKIKNKKYNKIVPEEYFWLNSKLPMWKEILN